MFAKAPIFTQGLALPVALAAMLLSGPASSHAAVQAPTTHRQAVTCTGVFLFVTIAVVQAVEENPSAENQSAAETIGRLTKAADDDRLAAARREGLTTEASGEALANWLNANIEDSHVVVPREVDACLGLYASAI